jgi:hypothetical protein
MHPITLLPVIVLPITATTTVTIGRANQLHFLPIIFVHLISNHLLQGDF